MSELDVSIFRGNETQ